MQALCAGDIYFMIKEITLGQYYRTDSLVHRLDPRTKLIITLFYLVSLFLYTNVYVYLLAGLFLATAIACSRVPISYMIKGLRGVMVFMIFTVVLNVFMIDGKVLVTIWKWTITWEGLRSAIYMAMRLVFLVFGSNLMTLTTTPNHLTDGMESVMHPLKKVRVPVHEIAMMMSIALRFIPILIDETDKIMKAQLARGADFESGNIFKRAKAMVPVLVPLFVSAFRRANDLAMAMEARCYHGGDGRTQMKPLKYERRDYIAYAVMALYMIFNLIFGKFVPKFW